MSAVHAVVVIPCYRNRLVPFERVALQRCLEVLGAHPLVMVTPADLDVAPLRSISPRLGFERFQPDYFRGVAGYNRMLLSDEFYARFATFEYMLIYQLDAFVFRDELLSWCARGYDYVGAPWLPENRMPTLPGLIRAAIKRRFYRLIDRRNRENNGLRHSQYDYTVGNGGFSLRRIAAMREVLRSFGSHLPRYWQFAHHSHAEDIFFCVEANRYRTRVRTPGLREAAAFSWESHPAAAAQLNHGELPFGCHGWNRLHHDDWRPIFARFGIALDEVAGSSG